MSEQKSALEQLLDMWDTDATIDETEPGKALLNIPKLHAKYVRVLAKHSGMSKMADQNLQIMRKRKSDYYNGRMTQEELAKYGLAPFKFVLKGEVREYIDSDQEVLTIQAKKAAHDEVVNLCNSILKELSARTWQLRSYIDWERTIMGQ